jgi:soluble lytic murein transglycosylase-like protein
VQARFPKSHAVVEATLAYAIGTIGGGKPALALAELNRLRPRLLEKKDVPEIDYWKARALEARAPAQAVALYLKVLRSDTPTHFAYFARHRLAAEPLVSRVRAGAAARAAEVQRRLEAGDLDAARRAQTDAVLLAPPDREPAELTKLADIYKKMPVFRDVVELPAPEYPRFPLFAGESAGPPDRLDLLLAMGLFDDATDLVQVRYPLQTLATGVARAEALRRGLAARASISAAETVARDDIPGRLRAPAPAPPGARAAVSALLLRRDHAESAKHKADPRLVLSIMREESRFNPRAKSAAAARGLLQFIITTARDVGQAIGLVQVSPEDLYDPKVVIQLGAKYIGDLLGQFERDGYKVAAAYNAGPTRRSCGRAWPRARRRHVPVRDQLRRDEGLRAQGPQQLRALRGDLREPAARGRGAAGSLARRGRAALLGQGRVVGEEHADHVQQLGREHGLDQVEIAPGVFALRHVDQHALRGQEDHGQVPRLVLLADLAAHVVAAEPGHGDVEDHEVEGCRWPAR